MTDRRPPNPSTLWAEVLVSELAADGLSAVCIAPGSRSTPLTVAFAAHPDVEVYSHLDERSAAFFALGRARRTGEPTALVSTSGTAAANFHPAVIEAHQGRVPLLLLTADRPRDLRDSGANQTIDQVDLYGDAVRWAMDLPEARLEERPVEMLWTTAARALAAATGTPAGPVHLNCPFRKPLEPVETGEIDADFLDRIDRDGDEGPAVRTTGGTPVPAAEDVARIAETMESADRPLVVAGPADPPGIDAGRIAGLARAVGAPILADPLSGLRFGEHVRERDGESPRVVFGGYDAYLPDPDLAPDVVLRVGASPTSKPLRNWLSDVAPKQFLIDPAGGWREATYAATDLVVADPDRLVGDLLAVLETDGNDGSGDAGTSGSAGKWLEDFHRREAAHWSVVERATDPDRLAAAPFEGAVLAAALAEAPDPATVFVSNSMPIRDADRFGRPRAAELSVLANRGASGIDGITSTGLGAGSAVEEPLVIVTGDLAFYHDSNGLLAVGRCGVDATIVVLDNDGGGIFHMLPIEEFDPPFTEQFKTPHGLEFSYLAECYGLEFECVAPADFSERYRASLASAGTQVLSVAFDAEASHRRREELEERSLTGGNGDE
ncbi:2-succinyl-5-enolpyruvyl-6-hydroxy-3-cyclohexene-1-carboxylic-acid synthase [Saliphagus infecundisoli]|uniref:2-succinyl-5-enolpyruvyl-6-hydroxy-3-cyclohexene-1-carboxylate synthase n=1 Tax=Saliphagus infecundisoli TaxID=1849069 RepID=A0ABD5QGJ6_9EURY|nr:2-succinyl-5-enolpyruvyl-6-hydroxy-3-cyclohexene-1-carboxylic-acid synthase [Saliphagus infecundisoli]